jgi:RHS repeat-associated protein
MHRVHFQLLAAWAASLLWFAPTTWAESTTGVPVRIWAVGTSNDLSSSPWYGSCHLWGTFVPASPGGSGYAESWQTTGSPYSQFTTNLGTVNVLPGARYIVYTSTACLASGNVFVVPPPGYDTIIEGMYRNAGPLVSALNFRIVPRFEGPPGAAGFASTISGGQVNWRMSLGFLRNGSEAGSLQLADPATASDLSNVFTPAALSYASPSPEVYVYQPNNILRQIIANQVAVDIVTLSSSSYEIRCYNPKQIQSYVPCTFSGQPFVTYRIERGTPDAARANDSTAVVIKLTRETRNITDTYQTNAPIARRDVMTLQRSGTWPNFLWIKNDWTLDGQTPLVRTTVQSSGTSQNRTESVTVGAATGPAIASLTRGYTLYPGCGEVLTSETLGTTNARTANFIYNTSTSSPGNLGYVSSVNAPGGAWERYDYYDASNSTSTAGGKVQTRYRPYVSTPATATGSMTGAEVTTYSYTEDPFGVRNRTTNVTTAVNGVTTAQTSLNYDNTDNGTNSGLVRVSQYNGSLVTIKRYFPEDCSDEYKRSQPVSIQQPNGVLTTFDYEVGRWDGTSFTVGSSGDTTNNASRITNTIGTAGTNGALTLVAGRSQKDVTIRDVRALPVRSESYVWDGANWQLTTWTNCVYNFSGLLLSRVSNNGATYTAVWDGEKKVSETNETGATLTYTYDAAGRVATTSRAAAGSIPATVTTFTYDALGNVVEQRVGASGGEQLVSTSTFDDATRPATVTPAGAGTTAYSYDVANRLRTITNPDGGTTIEASALDGRLVSKTGTAGVPEFYSYGVEGTTGDPAYGQHWTQVNYGTSTSARWKKTWQDKLDRVVTTQRPAFGSQTFAEQNTYDYYSGYLKQTTRTGLASTLYQYDAFGVVNRSGLDVDNNGVLSLASNDRIGDSNVTFELYNGAWWKKTTTIAYRTAGQSTPTTVKTVRQRLTGFPAGRLEETQETDVQGNVTITTRDVDRASSKVTVTVTRTGQTWKQVQVSINGLVVQATGTDGLTTTTAYDALNRAVSVTDARGNTTRTTYYPGTQLVQSVIDATNTTVSTTTYDQAGRILSKTDAAGHRTYFSYDLQGHTLRQWGDGAYPVSYGYDPVFGDRVTMSTYRGGTGWDQAAWPGTAGNLTGNPGTADTTTWSFDAASGLLASKTDASGRVVSYTYDSAGRLSTRTWARGVVTTYTYDAATGDQNAIQYSDGTPALGYTYNRVGESAQVTLGAGSGSIVETFDRDIAGKITAEHLDPTFFGGRTLTSKLNAQADGTKGRTLGYTLASGATTEQDLTYAYDPATDRFATLTVANTGVAAAAHTFRYAYLTNSPLVSALSVDGSPFTISRTFESQRDVLTSVTGQWSTATRTRYDYTTNTLGQRTSVRQSGDAFADYGDSSFQLFTYNSRSEVTGATGYLGSDIAQTTQPLPGRNLSFAYDNLGNRQSSNRTGNSADADNYTTNPLNQIVTRQNHAVQVSGTADANAKVAIEGRPAVASRQGKYWSDEVPVANGSGPWRGPLLAYIGKSGAGAGGTDLLRIDSRIAQIAAASQSFSYDLDGNLTADGLWDYTWDAENRLVAMQTSVAAANAGLPNQRLEFKYDYLGRRIEKLVRGGWNGSSFTTVTLQRRYIYDGWNLIGEYTVGTAGALTLVRSYTWGLDIARTLSDAGGVGALLQVTDNVSGKAYYACYNGNGDVAALINADSGSLAAAYEYTPYGEPLRSQSNDPSITDNPFRFSTKYLDQETGNYYYGRRYYDPKNGRFLGRDPLEEKGGINLYAFCLNNPINAWDVLGNLTEQEASDQLSAYYQQHQVQWWGNSGAGFAAQFSPALMFSSPGQIASAGVSNGIMFSGVSYGTSGWMGGSSDSGDDASSGSSSSSSSGGTAKIISSTKNADGSITYKTTSGDVTVTTASNTNFNSSGMTLVGGAHVSVTSGGAVFSPIGGGALFVAPNAVGAGGHYNAGNDTWVDANGNSHGFSVAVGNSTILGYDDGAGNIGGYVAGVGGGGSSGYSAADIAAVQRNSQNWYNLMASQAAPSPFAAIIGGFQDLRGALQTGATVGNAAPYVAVAPIVIADLLAPAATTVAKDLHFDGPQRGSRLAQIRYGNTPLVRLDYGRIPGSQGQSRLHLNIGPARDNIHIPIDPRTWFKDGR